MLSNDGPGRTKPVTPQWVGAAGDPPAAFVEGAWEIPVYAERMAVRKELRVAEELEIEKRAVQETERVTDTVRKEVVNVEEVGDVDVHGGSGTNLSDRS